MKWHSIKTHKPSYDGIYLVRIVSDSEPGGDVYTDVCEYMGNQFHSAFTDDHNWITHFAVFEPIEIND